MLIDNGLMKALSLNHFLQIVVFYALKTKFLLIVRS